MCRALNTNVGFNHGTFNVRFSELFFSLSCSSQTNQRGAKKSKRKTTSHPATHNGVGQFLDLGYLFTDLLENLLALGGHGASGGENERVEIGVLDFLDSGRVFSVL